MGGINVRILNIAAFGLALLAGSSAWAQAQSASTGSASGSAVDASKFSAAIGTGFYANDDDDGFLLNFEGTYHIDESWSAGVDFQLGFDDDFVLLSMPFYGQYDFGNIPGDIPVFSDMHPFARLGMGFTYADFDPSGPGSFDDTGFLFVIGGGLSYPLNESVSIDTRMQFNITTNDLFRDDYYFSWEMASLRYRF
jgi:hypothetical protein